LVRLEAAVVANALARKVPDSLRPPDPPKWEELPYVSACKTKENLVSFLGVLVHPIGPVDTPLGDWIGRTHAVRTEA
jgi:hypothetical protein